MGGRGYTRGVDGGGGESARVGMCPGTFVLESAIGKRCAVHKSHKKTPRSSVEGGPQGAAAVSPGEKAIIMLK